MSYNSQASIHQIWVQQGIPCVETECIMHQWRKWYNLSKNMIGNAKIERRLVTAVELYSHEWRRRNRKYFKITLDDHFSFFSNKSIRWKFQPPLPPPPTPTSGGAKNPTKFPLTDSESYNWENWRQICDIFHFFKVILGEIFTAYEAENRKNRRAKRTHILNFGIWVLKTHFLELAFITFGTGPLCCKISLGNAPPLGSAPAPGLLSRVTEIRVSWCNKNQMTCAPIRIQRKRGTVSRQFSKNYATRFARHRLLLPNSWVYPMDILKLERVWTRQVHTQLATRTLRPNLRNQWWVHPLLGNLAR